MKRPITLKDVSHLAGVSTATVARVLHQNGYVSERTRHRVERALADSGYRINTLAQGLRTQQSFTFGHLLQGVWPNPFFAGVALGVEQEALKRGYSVLMYDSRFDVDRERRGVERFLERRVDGIVFTTAIDPVNVQLALDAKVPVVQVERIMLAQTGTVLIDHYRGARDGMRHLLELGHRRVAYVGGDPKHYDASVDNTWNVEAERLRGFRDAFEEAGIPRCEDLVALGRYYSVEDNDIDDEGYRQVRRFLALEDPPTAVFAACDLLAAGALQALYEANLRVPLDVSVLGFDDTLAPHLAPPLTTVQLPMKAIGAAASRMLLDAQAGAELSGRTTTLTPKLVVRRSTGPAPTR
jgi:DNA-binding LacI/PurR family transcriptional regulator